MVKQRPPGPTTRVADKGISLAVLASLVTWGLEADGVHVVRGLSPLAQVTSGHSRRMRYGHEG